MSQRKMALTVGAFLALVVLLPFLQVAVWNGAFPLTITVHSSPLIELAHLKIEPCWNQSYADFAMNVGTTDAGIFEDEPLLSPQSADANVYIVRVPCTGRSGPYWIEYSYIEAKFLVVEYQSTVAGKAQLVRKQFSIPKGRGPRSMTITLP